MKPSGSGKVANGLVAMSCAGVLAVYAAGYVRTRSAADQLDAQSIERRAAAPEERATGEHPAGEYQRPAPRREEARTEAPAATTGPRASRSFEPPAAPSPKPEPEHPVQAAVILDEPAATTAAPASVPEPKTQIASAAPAAALPPPINSLPPSPLPPPTPPPPSAAKWKDGTYYGWGTSRHGDIQAEVIVAGGHIASATISQCRTRYPCSVIDPLPPQVAQRQSPDVDYISRATQSTNAFYFAVVEALSKAK